MKAIDTQIFLTDIQYNMVKWSQNAAGIQLIPRNTGKHYEAGCRRILMYYLWRTGMSKTKLSMIFGYNQTSTVTQLVNGYEEWIRLSTYTEYGKVFTMIDNYLSKLLY